MRGGLILNMMLVEKLICVTTLITAITAVQIQNNPTSEMSTDEKTFIKTNKTGEQSDESGHEVETEVEDKKFLEDALKTVLDPNPILIAKNDDVVETFKIQLDEVDKENSTIELFMDEMDNMSLEICKISQEAIWDYMTDTNSEVKKNKMQREDIDTMQRIWSRVSVCAYNTTVCNNEDTQRTMNDIITIFKTSNDTDELAYYWKAFRDATGKIIRPIFKDYVIKMNKVAVSENFSDAGEMWRYTFEDDDFPATVDRVWNEIKPFYNLLHDYVRVKLRIYYKTVLSDSDKLIPAHILGNIWAQEWQAIYDKVAAYPHVERATVPQNQSIRPKDLFNAVDEFHQSIGFESAKESFQDIKETSITDNCLPSSHDMCDGVNYKINWCGDKISDVTAALSKAARLLDHVQYFKHYRNLQPLYRDGPNPAFHDAISDIAAMQLTSPKNLQTLNFVKVASTPESTINHLLWLALETFPLMAHAYILDKWRWDVFANSTMEDWNKHWWELRIRETGISPPVPRDESDLDPAAKYHVVSHVQYITFLISHVLEFQILLSLCKRANHTGPLHECSIYGVKEAGKVLSDGMSLGASEDWRTVLHTMTGETELSTKGILEYFAALKDFLKEETARLERNHEEMDTSAPIIIGIVVIVLVILMFILYCVKKRDSALKLLSYCGLSKNGSLDIVTSELSHRKSNDVVGVSEDKV
ncbi:angiotensin-converting enzyme isoform X2 [Bicyclus anynana]|uniref:Angiotensin-converting enzyme n=1 Tax=Bicyclus anynana TaxID=110368 RepID=A0A6J1MI15_BICAN|nr:angiotensin-converting enzyme isoform X2 [Bicyclus anynana]